jgi:glutamine amidotransferase
VIALIDYKAGNLTSVRKAFGALGAQLFTPERADELEAADAIVVPGVGHFAATKTLGPEWIEAILARVGEGRPLLGICLGMQWLFEGSEESPELPGLGLLNGRCYRLPADNVKIPHVGWNSLAFQHRNSIVDDVGDGAQVYFTHSYVAPVTATPSRSRAMDPRSRLSSSADTSRACSSILKNPETSDCRCSGTS